MSSRTVARGIVGYVFCFWVCFSSPPPLSFSDYRIIWRRRSVDTGRRDGVWVNVLLAYSGGGGNFALVKALLEALNAALLLL